MDIFQFLKDILSLTPEIITNWMPSDGLLALGEPMCEWLLSCLVRELRIAL